MRRDEAILLDVYLAATLARQFVRDIVDVEMFRQDVKTVSAVQHQLLIVGEATKRLSVTYREAHPEVPWKAMAGLRDILIHAYDVVDVYELWQILSKDVPALIANMEPLLPARPDT